MPKACGNQSTPVAIMASTAALLTRLEDLERGMSSLNVADAAEAAAEASTALAASRAAAEAGALDGLRQLMRQHAAEASATAAEIGAACVGRELAAAAPRLRLAAQRELEAARPATVDAATQAVADNDELVAQLHAQREEADGLREALDAQHVQAGAAQRRHDGAIAAQAERHQQVVQRFEEQLAAERSRSRLEQETDADVFAKRVLQAESKARAAERRAEKAEAKLQQLELAAREWAGVRRRES